MKDRKKKDKVKLVVLENTPILKPLSIEDIGHNGDPCFSKGYDLSTKECKMCGDSELCAIAFAQTMNKTRSDIEKENQFKDMEILIDVAGVKKFMRKLKRGGSLKKEIITKSQEKFKITKEESRQIYKQLIK